MDLGLGNIPLKKPRFRKLMEESDDEWQKPLIFKSLTKRISHF